MSKPTVSVLIPVYNRELFVVDAIESAQRQTLSNIEIIVVDNMSTDSTYDVVCMLAEKDNRIRLYRNDSNLGPVLNWQRCISLASADISKILWSDDWLDPEYLEKTVPILSNNDDVGFVYTPVIVHSQDSTRILYDQLPKTGLYDLSIFLEDLLFWGGERYPGSPGCALFRTHDLKRNLLIDIPNNLGLDYKKLGGGNDLLLFMLCYENYTKFGFQKIALSHFRGHAGCLSNAENISLFYLDSMRHFVEYGKGRIYRDRYYSFLYLCSLSQSKGKLHKMVLDNAKYRKNYSFMFNWRLEKTVKRIVNQFRKLVRKLS